MKRRNIRKVNNLFLTTALIFICLISIAYSAINSNLLISGDVAYTYTTNTLYNQVKKDTQIPSKYAKKYTGDTSTFNGGYDVYYYYGEAKDNNVIFANYCWKMVRTTDTGGVKLLYNGVPSSDGKCNNSGTNSLLTKEQMNTESSNVEFNTNYDSISDIGYMSNIRYPSHTLSLNGATYKYGNSYTYSNNKYTLVDTKDLSSINNGAIDNYHYTCWNTTGVCEELSYIYVIDFYQRTWDPFYIKLKNGKGVQDVLNETLYAENVKDSTLKKAVDYWYSKHMTEYTNYLEDTFWCGDRTISDLAGWNSNGGSVTSYLMFTSNENLSELKCSNVNDRFSVDKNNGNGSLTYPVGFLTRQEVQLAFENNTSPLNNGENTYWIMSPGNFNQGIGSIYKTNTNGAPMFYNTSEKTVGVRPSISLKADTLYISGDGSTELPYVITEYIPENSLYHQVTKDVSDTTKYVKKYEGDTSTFIGNKDIYYYYGEAQNNNVIFANYCWKIVRTTDTGGVKLLYNGVPSNGICTNTNQSIANILIEKGTSIPIGRVGFMFNSTISYNASKQTPVFGAITYANSVKFENGMYKLIDTTSSEEAQNNYHYTCGNTQTSCSTVKYITGSTGITLENGKVIEDVTKDLLHSDEVNKEDSIIKKELDKWYVANLVDYAGYLEDTVWCNDRSIISLGGWNPNGGTLNAPLQFNSSSEINDLTCKNIRDSFTVNLENGNNKLNYPIGLLTKQEAELAKENTSPLSSSIPYWTMSPSKANNVSSVGLYSIGSAGQIEETTIGGQSGLRPSISLRYNTTFTSGDGSVNNPYLIVN